MKFLKVFAMVCLNNVFNVLSNYDSSLTKISLMKKTTRSIMGHIGHFDFSTTRTRPYNVGSNKPKDHITVIIQLKE